MAGEIDQLLKVVKDRSASDLHLRVGATPMLRIDGELQPAAQSHPALSAEICGALIGSIMDRTQKELWYKKHDIDFSYEITGLARYRVNAFFTRLGPAAVFRLIPYQISTLQELGLPPHVLKFADYRKGMFLVTGATGSGKSTTLATLVDHINRNRNEHIITIEDPIEFVHDNKNCLVSQREVGPDTDSFALALRAALREDPDIILVGELRDLETIELALTAAETGHLVFSTLHTNSAADSIDRMVNVFPEAQQQQIRQVASNVLIGIMAQNLIRRKDGAGRVVACEIMVCNSAVSNLIREGKSHQIPSAIQTGSKDGMQLMDQSLEDLYNAGKISAQDAYMYAKQKDLFTKFLPSGGIGGASQPTVKPHSNPQQTAAGGAKRWI